MIILNDYFQRFSLQKRIFTHRMIDNIVKNGSPPLDISLRLMCHGRKAFNQFIDTLIETKQNDIAHLFENYQKFQLLLPFL